MSKAYDSDPLFAQERKETRTHKDLADRRRETRRNSAAEREEAPMPKCIANPREYEEVEMPVSTCEIKVDDEFASIGVVLRNQDGRSMPNKEPWQHVCKHVSRSGNIFTTLVVEPLAR